MARQRPFFDFLESCLRHKSEMVIFEAARAIAEMNEVTTRELTPAITVLQLFLSSSKPVLRFAAVRTLNKARAPHTPLAAPHLRSVSVAAPWPRIGPSRAAPPGSGCPSLLAPGGVPRRACAFVSSRLFAAAPGLRLRTRC